MSPSPRVVLRQISPSNPLADISVESVLVDETAIQISAREEDGTDGQPV